ncbi:MAG: iron-containing alcohol dehydrogenase, partial [Clostridia bacterium]|nr:iron-containing alcohol dehydrogenase [Clostridia bacterium]
NAGVTMPHGIGMTISGHCPHVMHGESLAVTYPEFTRYTYPYAVKKFATMGRILNPELEKESDETAAEKSCEAVDALLKEIGMWLSFESLHVPEDELSAIAKDQFLLSDYTNNPRVATEEEILTILKNSYKRQG